MSNQLVDAWRTIAPERGDPFGPLPPMLVALTVVTGLVDAYSYLNLGHVFVANMTGNVVFLAFALAGAPGFSIAASLVALGSFAVGSLAGGRLAVLFAHYRGRLLTIGASGEVILLAAATAVSAASGNHVSAGHRYVLIVVLAAALGLQNAMARKLAVPDLTTTVLTLTTTGIFADSKLVGGPSSKAGRRLLSILAMFAGAVVGAVLVVHGSKTFALVVALVLLVIVALLVQALSRHRPGWAVS